jgi:hypothetical protein
MLLRSDDYPPGPGCDCAAHKPGPASNTEPGVWSAIAPALACAVCPACLATCGQVLSVFGVGFGITESQHGALLVVAVGASLAVSGLRSWRTRRPWPVAIAALGAALVLTGHGLDVHGVEWAGILVLVMGGVTEHVKLRSRRSSDLAATH